MNDRGWIFADVLVALGILLLGLAFIFPAQSNLQSLEDRQETRLHSAFEAQASDVREAFR